MLNTSSQTTTATTNSTVDPEFKKIFDRYFALWGPGTSEVDITEASKFYAQEPNQVFYDIIQPLRGYSGLDAYMVDIKKNFYDNFSNFTLTPYYDDLRVTRKGDVAWTTITFHGSGTPKNGGAMEADGRITNIWERRNEKWLIVHEHCSAPLG